MDINSMRSDFNVVIIGGGAVGCAIAYQLSRYDLSVSLLERAPDVCMGTSAKNSAVVHAGFNNRPGSLMAELCVKGNKQFESICKTLDVQYKKTGKLVVALDDIDLPVIDERLEAGRKNDCVGLSKISFDEMRKLEPNVNGIAALYSSNTAIFNPFIYTFHLAEAAMQNGVEFFLNHEVTSIEQKNGKFLVQCADTVFTADIVINSAGLYSDKVAAMNGDSQYRIYPNRGEYIILDKLSTEFVSRPIYPVPRTGVGGLGVHLTPTIDGNMLIGPSAEYVSDCEITANTKSKMDSMMDDAQTLLPKISSGMVIGAYTGTRPKTIPPGSDNFGDFIIEESPKTRAMINLIGIESPGLTASMPIAERVCDMLSASFSLTKKENWKPEYIGNPIFRLLDYEAQNNLIRDNPDYGEIICRCEGITRAEVLDAINNPLGVRTLVGIKNRVRTMTGRCQGGYCLTNLVDILTKTYGISSKEITYRSIGDTPFFGSVK